MPERGGPTTQSGVFYQNGIAALFLCMMMDERERDARDDVVRVRVEGLEHVDDVEIHYGDGRRRFVQAKEKIRRGSEEWRAMWRQFAAHRFSGDFGDSDRIELAIGNSSIAIVRLQEASKRARGTRLGTESEEEWWTRLDTNARELMTSIAGLLAPEHGSRACLYQLFATLDIVQRDPAVLEEHALGFLPQPPREVKPRRLFEALRAMIPSGARIREALDRDLVVERLRDQGIEIRAPYDTASVVAAASAELTAWPQTLGDGTWLERPLHKQLVDALRGEEPGCYVVLGGPGCGKSALLARVASALQQAGTHVLAIKADRLPQGVCTRDHLREAQDLPDDPIHILRSLAARGPTVLVVDQLDALSDLVDMHTRRLDVLLRLVTDAMTIDGVSVVVSSRTLELEHDVRFRQLRGKRLMLEPLELVDVARVLEPRGVELEALSAEARELLRLPHWLRLYLELYDAEAPLFESEFALLERFWAQRVSALGEAGERLVTELAQKMAEREELWIGAVSFAEQQATIDKLIANGVLRYDDASRRRLGFAHQTLFELSLVRAFAEVEGSLLAHIRARNGSLFVRPTVWSALRYLRSSHARDYLSSVRELLVPPTRPHLRQLTLEFLGQLFEPSDEEAAIVLPLVLDERRQGQALQAMSGNPHWFARLMAGHMPSLMSSAPPGVVVHLLIEAGKHTRDEVVALLASHWLLSAEHRGALLSVLYNLDDWSEEARDIVLGLLRERAIGQSEVKMLVHTMKGAPVLAIDVVTVYLEGELETVRARVAAMPNPEREAARRAPMLSERPGEDLLSSAHDLHGLDAAAGVDPSAFVTQLWPWFVSVLELLSNDAEGTSWFRRDWSINTSPVGDGYGSFAGTLGHALRKWAASEPVSFLAFATRAATSELMTAQAFLIEGLRQIATTHADEVVEHLLADDRRLLVTVSAGYDAGTTKSLLNAVAPHLTDTQKQSLRGRIDQLTPFEGDTEDVKHRQRRLQATIALRDELKQALCDVPLADTRTEESEAVQPRRRRSGFQPVRSPMSHEQMLRANDRDIVNFFAGHPDEELARTSWHNRSLEASRELEKLAERDPQRARRLIDSFEPATHQRPVAHMIKGLVAASEDIEGIVLACEARGFGNPEYREDIAYALVKTADPGGLSESLCAMLSSWLSHGQEPPSASAKRGSARDEGRTDSILWGMHGGEALPHGNYPILYCLALGYLLRRPPDDLAWLEVLEQHIERDEQQEVWHALTRQLRYVGSADQVRGTRVIDSVLSRYPDIRDSVRGAMLVAHTCGWVDQAALRRWLDDMRVSPWPRGAQAYGEIVGLRSTFTRGEWAAEVVDDIVTSPDGLSREALGVAHACAHLWDQDGDRARMTELIATMLPSATGPVADALLRAFPRRDHIVIDPHLLHLLDVLAEHPQVLAHRPPLFLDMLQRLMTTAPDRVIALCQAMVAGLEAGAASEIHMDGPRLVALALTFQRMDSFRAEGLEIFERLLEIGCYGVSKALDELRPRIGASG